MKNKIFWLLPLGALFASLMVACGDKKSGSPASTPTPTYTCSAGQVYTQHGCLSQGSCPVGQGFYNGQCYGGQTSGTGARTFGNRISITNGSTYRKFLKNNGVCDTYTVNYGLGDCDNWDSMADVYLEVSSTTLPTQARVTILAYSNSGWGYSSATRSFSGTLSPINNNSGFQMNALGYTMTPGWNNYLIIKADPGNLTGSNVIVRLYYTNDDGAEIEFGKVDLRKLY